MTAAIVAVYVDLHPYIPQHVTLQRDVQATNVRFNRDVATP